MIIRASAAVTAVVWCLSAPFARALDAHAGEGVRILITYGAGHRSWFILALKQRADIVLVDPAPYVDKAGIPR